MFRDQEARPVAQAPLSLSVVLLAGFSLGGCGDEDPATCDSATRTFCDRACACGPGFSCAWETPDGRETIGDRASCVFVTGGTICESTDATEEDFQLCQNAMRGRSCIVSTDGERLAVPVSPSCLFLLEEAGP